MNFMLKHKRAIVYALVIIVVFAAYSFAQSMPIPFVDVQMREAQSPKEVSLALQILFLLTILSLAPSIIIMMTSFIRVSIVLNFIQRALSLQDVPPKQIIMGLSLFLTFFIMQPTFMEINEAALKPYLEGNVEVTEFYKGAEKPIRKFMLTTMNTEKGLRSLETFFFISKSGNLSEITAGKTIDDLAADTEGLSTFVLIPSFIIHELTVAFEIGIYLFVPFIVIDLIVASSLMAMGMIMLPPVMVSLPLKILLFIAIDGWNLLTIQLVESYI